MFASITYLHWVWATEKDDHFVTFVRQGGPGEGLLQVGDKIITIAGIPPEKVTHEYLIKTAAKATSLKLVVLRTDKHLTRTESGRFNIGTPKDGKMLAVRKLVRNKPSLGRAGVVDTSKSAIKEEEDIPSLARSHGAGATGANEAADDEDGGDIPKAIMSGVPGKGVKAIEGGKNGHDSELESIKNDWALPKGEQPREIEIQRSDAGFGFSLISAIGKSSKTIGVFVREIKAPPAKNSGLRVGDQLLRLVSPDGLSVDLSKASKDEAVTALRGMDRVTLVVVYNKKDFKLLTSSKDGGIFFCWSRKK